MVQMRNGDSNLHSRWLKIAHCRIEDCSLPPFSLNRGCMLIACQLFSVLASCCFIDSSQPASKAGQHCIRYLPPPHGVGLKWDKFPVKARDVELSLFPSQPYSVGLVAKPFQVSRQAALILLYFLHSLQS